MHLSRSSVLYFQWKYFHQPTYETKASNTFLVSFGNVCQLLQSKCLIAFVQLGFCNPVFVSLYPCICIHVFVLYLHSCLYSLICTLFVFVFLFLYFICIGICIYILVFAPTNLDCIGSIGFLQHCICICICTGVCICICILLFVFASL